MRFKLILSSVKPDLTDNIIEAAKKAGATGATIIPARGTGVNEAKTFFGLTLEAQTDIILFLVEEHIAVTVLKQIEQAGRFDKPGTGIAFSVPVENAVGLESQIKIFKDEAKDAYF